MKPKESNEPPQRGSNLVDVSELKSLRSVSQHFPRESGGLGVEPEHIFDLLVEERLKIDMVEIDNATFFIIPRSDQKKPDWGLGARLSKNSPSG